MSLTRPPYPSGFREQMVELVRSGRSPEELAREFEPSAQSIRNWVSQADRDEGRPSSAAIAAMSATNSLRSLAQVLTRAPTIS